MLSLRALAVGAVISLVSLGSPGCGFERLAAPLPNNIDGLTLEQLKQIQNDERLTDDEKREEVRNAAGLANDPDGNRTADFLLNLNIP